MARLAPPGTAAQRSALHSAAPALASGSCGRLQGLSYPQTRVRAEDGWTPAVESLEV